jgi:hypothetical protein
LRLCGGGFLKNKTEFNTFSSELSGTFFGIFRNFLRNFPELSSALSGTFFGTFRNFLRNFPELRYRKTL